VRVVSKRVAAHLVAIGVDARKIVTLAIASDLTAFRKRDPIEDAHNLRVQYPDADTIVLSVGRLVKEKNFAVLIRAFKKVVTSHPKTQLVIIGSGPEKDELVALVTSCNLSTQVAFIPWTDDVVSYMRSADIFALSSYREGWGRVIIEAMAAGLPGVVTDVGCAGEVFIHKRHGIVVPVDDVGVFAETLQELIANVSLRCHYGETARRHSEAYAAQEGSYAWAWLGTIEACTTSKNSS
jgi:glycosyltransferase involved in cell wall biosynthesis